MFKEAVCNNDGNPKGVLVVHSDGGPDENIRFIKTICCYVQIRYTDNMHDSAWNVVL